MPEVPQNPRAAPGLPVSKLQDYLAEHVMGELDTHSWTERARYLALMRRRMWQCRLGMYASRLFVIPFFLVWHVLNPSVQGVVLLLFILIQCAWLLLGNEVWFALTQFRCPRCGKGFREAFGFGFSRNQCKHCGLDLGLAVIDKAKSIKGGDSWE
jgi:hypothetical protein